MPHGPSWDVQENERLVGEHKEARQVASKAAFQVSRGLGSTAGHGLWRTALILAPPQYPHA